MRPGRLIGLSVLAIALGLGAVSIITMYADGEQQQALLIRVGIPGAMLLALAIGTLLVWGFSLRSEPEEPEPFPLQSFGRSYPETLDQQSKQSEEEGPQ